MLDSNNRGSRDFSHFNELSTEELRNIIHQDSMLEENEDSDLDAILYIMDVLAKREKEENHGNVKDVDAAWQSFKKDYYPYADDPAPLFSFSDTDEIHDPEPEKIRRPILKRLIRPLSIAAIIIVVLLAGTITSYALGFDLWGAFADWTHETFRFSNSEADAESQPFANLRDALDVYGVEDPIVPNWLPNDYGEDIVQVTEVPDGVHFVSRYEEQTWEMSINVNYIQNNEPVYRTYERQNIDIDIYISNGLEHYIMRNGNNSRVIWVNGYNECSILCDLQGKDIYRMIDSIYEG